MTTFQQPAPTTSNAGPDPELRFYRSLLEMTHEERDYQVLEVLVRELRGNEAERRWAIWRRFLAWSSLSIEEGAALATAYEHAASRLSPDDQRALDEAEREVVLNGLSYAQFGRLAEFLPWLRAWHLPEAPARPAHASLPAALLALAGSN